MKRQVVLLSLQSPARWLVLGVLCLFLIAGILFWHRYSDTISLDRDPADRLVGPPTVSPFPDGIQSLNPGLESIRALHHVPALAAAIIRDNRIVAMGAVGVRKAGSAARIDISDRFHIGSCTKSMTATLIGILVDQGALRWDMTLGEIFADLPDSFRPEYRSVTIDQLLHHQSGLPDDRDDVEIYHRILNLRGPISRQRKDLVRIGLQMKPVPAKELQTNYSNMGYSILGAIVERVTGRSWEENMQNSLFMPLGMKTAGFGSPSSGRNLDQPWGHHIISFPFRRLASESETSLPAAASPSGNVSLSLEDWAKYALIHLNAEQGRCRLLKCETFRHLHSAPAGSRMACGWGLNQYDWAGTVLEHAGSEGSWYATIGIAPEKNFAILTVSNEGDPAGGRACSEAALVASKLWLQRNRIP